MTTTQIEQEQTTPTTKASLCMLVVKEFRSVNDEVLAEEYFPSSKFVVFDDEPGFEYIEESLPFLFRTQTLYSHTSASGPHEGFEFFYNLPSLYLQYKQWKYPTANYIFRPVLVGNVVQTDIKSYDPHFNDLASLHGVAQTMYIPNDSEIKYLCNHLDDISTASSLTEIVGIPIFESIVDLNRKKEKFYLPSNKDIRTEIVVLPHNAEQRLSHKDVLIVSELMYEFFRTKIEGVDEDYLIKHTSIYDDQDMKLSIELSRFSRMEIEWLKELLTKSNFNV